ncbi:Cullin-domain-containing protein [Rickenella mellea]|uniref:Cullin-domain-containing protein n=1 Tax=Rickenella mellea TaxID=50990 RepID=A0A4Y7Q9T2_9AGAM|nr:Cullin-domain-containing protein [Rickenella mellea]
MSGTIDGTPIPPYTADLQTMCNYLEKGVCCILSHPGTISYARYQGLYAVVWDYCHLYSPGEGEDLGEDVMQLACRAAGIDLCTDYYVDPTPWLTRSDIYLRLARVFAEHVKTISEALDLVTGEDLLLRYVNESERYNAGAKEISRLFTYLREHFIRIFEGDRCVSPNNVYPLTTLAVRHWRQLFNRHMLKISKAVLDVIELHRHGAVIDQDIVKRAINSFISDRLNSNDVQTATPNSLEIYAEFFDSPIIAATRNYYSATSKCCLEENGTVAYITWAYERIKAEEELVERCLLPFTQDSLIGTCERLLITEHLEILQGVFPPLFDSDMDKHLRPLYGLLSRVPNGMDPLLKKFGPHVDFNDIRDVQRRYLMMSHIRTEFETLRNTFEAHAEALGTSTISEWVNECGASDILPQRYVDKLLEVHEKNLDTVRLAFDGDASFIAALDKASCVFVNKNAVAGTSRSKSPELLMRYIDAILRSGNKGPGLDDSKIEHSLSQAITIFKYLDEKDIFQTFYAAKLAKRLIYHTPVSENCEIMVIQKFQEICGIEYTNKMSRMMTEINLSRDLTNQFKEHIDRSFPGDKSLNLGVLVLGTNFWPLDVDTSGFAIPTEISPTLERFNRFFQAKHSGRKLTWLWNYSSTELRSSFWGREYIMTTSAYQMAVLMQFNNWDELSLEEIHAATAMSKEVLRQTMEPLTKSKILVQSGADNIKLNESFKSKKMRINLNQPVRKTVTEADDVVQGVEKDRKYVIQANIIRLMKANKTMTYQALIREVMSQVARWFTPKIPDIKRAIDLLLEKEYIRRIVDAKDSFEYIA